MWCKRRADEVHRGLQWGRIALYPKMKKSTNAIDKRIGTSIIQRRHLRATEQSDVHPQTTGDTGSGPPVDGATRRPLSGVRTRLAEDGRRTTGSSTATLALQQNHLQYVGV